MASSSKPKLTQAEMLEKLSPAPFDMRNVVPHGSKIQASPEARWWRSSSPERDNDGSFHPDEPRQAPPREMSATRGVLGLGKRQGPVVYSTSAQTGSNTSPVFNNGEEVPPHCSGYSGFIAGKVAGNVIGGTFDATNQRARDHLEGTGQAQRFGPTKRLDPARR